MRHIGATIIGMALLLGSVPLGAADKADKAARNVPTGFRMAGKVLVHEASDAHFPVKAAGFTRSHETAYSADGNYYVVTYSRKIDGEPVVARIAVVQMFDLTPQLHFAAMRAAVGTLFPGLAFTDVQQGGEGPFNPPFLKTDSGYQGRFTARLGTAPYELSLTTVKLGEWDARLTAAYPASRQTQARDDIVALVQALKLPQH